MSGGIAYVLDESGEFCRTRCNRLGVDLEPVEDASDINALRNLVERHVQLTGSPRGKWVLENWGDLLPRFVKVFPHEYKRVLAGRAARAEAATAVAAK